MASVELATPEELDAAAERLERSGARGPASMGNLAYATEDDVRLLRRAANMIRALSGQSQRPVPPPYRPEPRMWSASKA